MKLGQLIPKDVKTKLYQMAIDGEAKKILRIRKQKRAAAKAN